MPAIIVLFFGPQVEFAEKISESDRMLLFDPQTSGGLLLGVPENRSLDFQDRAKQLKTEVWSIGKVIAGEGIKIIE